MACFIVCFCSLRDNLNWIPLWRSFVTTELVSLYHRVIGTDSGGCVGCRRFERAVSLLFQDCRPVLGTNQPDSNRFVPEVGDDRSERLKVKNTHIMYVALCWWLGILFVDGEKTGACVFCACFLCDGTLSCCWRLSGRKEYGRVKKSIIVMSAARAVYWKPYIHTYQIREEVLIERTSALLFYSVWILNVCGSWSWQRNKRFVRTPGTPGTYNKPVTDKYIYIYI